MAAGQAGGEQPAAHPMVVAIGVSHDGIGALQRVLAPLSQRAEATVLIVRHLAPTVPSALSAILRRGLAVPVKEAVEGDSPQAGIIYVAPPDLHLMVVDGQVGLHRGPRVKFSRPSMDVLFDSVARVCGARSSGVLVSGAGTDGADGLAAIRRAGGLTIVQDPSEARTATMPRAALARNGHRVLKLDEITAVLRAAT